MEGHDLKHETSIRTIIAKLERQRQALREILDDLREVERSPPNRNHWITLDEHERELIAASLRRTDGNQSETARLLGITRDRLRYKIRKYKLETKG